MVKPPGYNTPPCDMHPSKAPTSGIASATLEQMCNLQIVKPEYVAIEKVHKTGGLTTFQRSLNKAMIKTISKKHRGNTVQPFITQISIFLGTCSDITVGVNTVAETDVCLVWGGILEQSVHTSNATTCSLSS